ncbi:murein hydrolase activator EnvC family protein [Aquimarina sp. 2201CG14-23]|uniref:murein hydrolase activator EnvC family protein n=1 Tax=Aquimarina mycalae TaxID=3040073 RepID=UPI00247806B5|nr:peptidoglycan DD-metalloendopeptidase family protein [Aquimarina sp. 2201CG14-23]MDH7446414.1 peptidoglycan DD-metalloendopeptidase family protein [Aquimarina sp. 2201CG14-23]
MRLKRYIYIIGVLLVSIPSFSQSTKQQQLEEQRRRLKEQIEQMRSLLADTKLKQRSVLDEVETLNSQISTRQNLIKITNQQANLLTREINSNLKKMQSYREELKVLKEDYARMIVKSYKSKSQQSKIMFLLSSSDFSQAYKRLQYMKQYNEHRKEQADQIQTRSEELQTLNKNLSQRKKNKQQLVEENREVQDRLNEEKKQQQVLMASIRKKEGTYKKEIKKKQEQASAIDKAIEKLIREAIAKANKKAGKKASKKGSATTFALTPEDKKLADSFTANKGKFPWPVGTGKLTKKYGRQPHPTLPNITINSSGVELETRPGEKARAIFDGEVMAIQKLKGAGRLVHVRHGNYITVYYNLENISVKEGQKLSTKQNIGEVRTNPTTGRAIMKFLIFKDTKKQNPQSWIYKM